MSKNVRLVYSTDPRESIKTCPFCKKHYDDCKCVKQEAVTTDYVVNFRIEKSGRGGKIVTVMDGWPRNEAFLKEITKELKAKCGSGGTFILTNQQATVEIQGDKRENLKKILTQKGIRFKGH